MYIFMHLANFFSTFFYFFSFFSLNTSKYICMVFIRVYVCICVVRLESFIVLRINAQIEHNKNSITIQSRLGKKDKIRSNGIDESDGGNGNSNKTDSLSFGQRVSWSWSFNACNELAFHSFSRLTVRFVCCFSLFVSTHLLWVDTTFQSIKSYSSGVKKSIT